MQEECILHERSTVEDGFGQVFQVTVTHSGLVRFTWLELNAMGEDMDNTVFLPQDAIAAAKAILKHFDVDFNAFEENIAKRYRHPTREELDKFLAENPNVAEINRVHFDPDAPLTSELASKKSEESQP